MTHYRLNDSMPSAVILSRNARTSSLDETKTYQNNIIFLENRQEFAIRLFNPLSEKVGVQIGLNKKFSNNLLILNPGEVTTLDRFVDDKKRMIFETYTYDKGNEASKKAVENNGIIEIKFFKEKQVQTYTSSNTYIYTNSQKPGKGNRKRKRTDKSELKGTFTDINSKNSNSRIYNHYSYNALINSTAGTDFVTTTASSYYSPIYVNFDSEITKINESLEETGRIEKGSESNQDFHQVEIEFENHPFYIVEFQLKPVSQKEEYDFKIRDYCSDCGYRLRNRKFNYCPKCGEKI